MGKGRGSTSSGPLFSLYFTAGPLASSADYKGSGPYLALFIQRPRKGVLRNSLFRSP